MSLIDGLTYSAPFALLAGWIVFYLIKQNHRILRQTEDFIFREAYITTGRVHTVPHKESRHIVTFVDLFLTRLEQASIFRKPEDGLTEAISRTSEEMAEKLRIYKSEYLA